MNTTETSIRRYDILYEITTKQSEPSSLLLHDNVLLRWWCCFAAPLNHTLPGSERLWLALSAFLVTPVLVLIAVHYSSRQGSAPCLYSELCHICLASFVSDGVISAPFGSNPPKMTARVFALLTVTVNDKGSLRLGLRLRLPHL